MTAQTHAESITHVVMMDESGNSSSDPSGKPMESIRSLWVAAAIAIEWAKKPQLDGAVAQILQQRLAGRQTELKGAELRRYLAAGMTTTHVAEDIAKVVKALDIQVWVCGARVGCPARKHMPGNEPKEIVRQLLLEKISGYTSMDTPSTRSFSPRSWILVWDLSYPEDLIQFSRSVATHRNLMSQQSLSSSLTPAILGGLSHDWSGLQIADVISNFALHRMGADLGLPDAHAQKAADFQKILYPTLRRNRSGNRVGWTHWK